MIKAGLGWSNKEAIMLYGWYTALVYLACIPGGIIGDRYINSETQFCTEVFYYVQGISH